MFYYVSLNVFVKHSQFQGSWDLKAHDNDNINFQIIFRTKYSASLFLGYTSLNFISNVFPIKSNIVFLVCKAFSQLYEFDYHIVLAMVTRTTLNDRSGFLEKDKHEILGQMNNFYIVVILCVCTYFNYSG